MSAWYSLQAWLNVLNENTFVTKEDNEMEENSQCLPIDLSLKKNRITPYTTMTTRLLLPTNTIDANQLKFPHAIWLLIAFPMPYATTTSHSSQNTLNVFWCLVINLPTLECSKKTKAQLKLR